jgi:hypothetical protein
MFVALMFGALILAAAAAQSPFDVKELAAYRLTAATFKPFEEASRLIAEVARSDAALASAPLFTKEITVSGDAPVMAAELEARLNSHPSLTQSLHAAGINAREYTMFALALITARLAHGFVQAGVMRSVPPGVATDNVAFVEAHLDAVTAVLKTLGVENGRFDPSRR